MKRTSRRYTGLILLCGLLGLELSMPLSSQAQPFPNKENSVAIVWDLSGSMRQNSPNREAATLIFLLYDILGRRRPSLRRGRMRRVTPPIYITGTTASPRDSPPFSKLANLRAPGRNLKAEFDLLGKLLSNVSGTGGSTHIAPALREVARLPERYRPTQVLIVSDLTTFDSELAVRRALEGSVSRYTLLPFPETTELSPNLVEYLTRTYSTRYDDPDVLRRAEALLGDMFGFWTRVVSLKTNEKLYIPPGVTRTYLIHLDSGVKNICLDKVGGAKNCPGTNEIDWFSYPIRSWDRNSFAQHYSRGIWEPDAGTYKVSGPGVTEVLVVHEFDLELGEIIAPKPQTDKVPEAEPYCFEVPVISARGHDLGPEFFTDSRLKIQARVNSLNRRRSNQGQSDLVLKGEDSGQIYFKKTRVLDACRPHLAIESFGLKDRKNKDGTFMVCFGTNSRTTLPPGRYKLDVKAIWGKRIVMNRGSPQVTVLKHRDYGFGNRLRIGQQCFNDSGENIGSEIGEDKWCCTAATQQKVTKKAKTSACLTNGYPFVGAFAQGQIKIETAGRKGFKSPKNKDNVVLSASDKEVKLKSKRRICAQASTERSQALSSAVKVSMVIEDRNPDYARYPSGRQVTQLEIGPIKPPPIIRILYPWFVLSLLTLTLFSVLWWAGLRVTFPRDFQVFAGESIESLLPIDTDRAGWLWRERRRMHLHGRMWGTLEALDPSRNRYPQQPLYAFSLSLPPEVMLRRVDGQMGDEWLEDEHGGEDDRLSGVCFPVVGRKYQVVVNRTPEKRYLRFDFV